MFERDRRQARAADAASVADPVSAPLGAPARPGSKLHASAATDCSWRPASRYRARLPAPPPRRRRAGDPSIVATRIERRPAATTAASPAAPAAAARVDLSPITAALEASPAASATYGSRRHRRTTAPTRPPPPPSRPRRPPTTSRPSSGAQDGLVGQHEADRSRQRDDRPGPQSAGVAGAGSDAAAAAAPRSALAGTRAAAAALDRAAHDPERRRTTRAPAPPPPPPPAEGSSEGQLVGSRAEDRGRKEADPEWTLRDWTRSPAPGVGGAGDARRGLDAAAPFAAATGRRGRGEAAATPRCPASCRPRTTSSTCSASAPDAAPARPAPARRARHLQPAPRHRDDQPRRPAPGGHRVTILSGPLTNLSPQKQGLCAHVSQIPASTQVVAAWCSRRAAPTATR